MPVVPRYDQPKVETQIPQLKLNANAPAEAFDMGQSRAQLENAQAGLLKTVTGFAAEEKKKADEVRLNEADSKLAEYQSQVEYGDKGIYSTKGLDTLKLHDGLKKSWTDKVSEISKDLTNDQQEAFSKVALRRWSNVNDGLQRHTFQEVQKHDKNVFENVLKNSQNEAMESFADPKRIKEAIQTQVQKIDEYAARNRVDAETKTQMVQESLNKTHALVVSKMLEAQNPQLAKFYFEANKDNITGEAEIQIGKMLKVSFLKDESQKQADKIVGSSSGIGAALDQLKDIQDVELKDATKERIKDFYSMQKLAKDRQQEDLHNYAGSVLQKSGGNMDAIPPNVIANMNPQTHTAIKRYAEFLKKGEEPATNWRKYTDLRSMASNPATREKFKNMDPMNYRADLDDSKFSEMVKLRDDLRQGSSKANAQLDAEQSNQAVIDQSLAAIKIVKKDDEEEYAQANRSIYERVNQWQVKNGKQISNEELRKIVDDELTQKVVGKKWFGLAEDKRRKFDVKPGEMPTKTILKKQYSPSRNQTRIQYSDGTTEVINGK